MVKNVAGLVVAPMWRKIFDAIGSDLPATPFPRPVYAYKNAPTVKPILRGIWQGGETYTVDKISGKLATQYTPKEMQLEVPVTNVHSILQWVNKGDPMGPPPTNPESDPQYIYWETPIRLWAAANGFGTLASSSKPTQFDDVHTPALSPVVSITSPADSTLIDPNMRVDINVQIKSHAYPIDSMEVYVNGVFVSKIKALPEASVLSYSFVPSTLENISASTAANELRVVVYDSMRNQGSASLTFHTTQPPQ